LSNAVRSVPPHLQKVVAGARVERFQPPVIKDREICRFAGGNPIGDRADPMGWRVNLENCTVA
jgi:hypothetical protein